MAHLTLAENDESESRNNAWERKPISCFGDGAVWNDVNIVSTTLGRCGPIKSSKGSAGVATPYSTHGPFSCALSKAAISQLCGGIPTKFSPSAYILQSLRMVILDD